MIEKMRQLQQCREDCRAEAAAAVLELRRKCLAELEVEAEEELSDAAVAARLAQIGGAHRPNGYDFGDAGGAVRVEEE